MLQECVLGIKGQCVKRLIDYISKFNYSIEVVESYFLDIQEILVNNNFNVSFSGVYPSPRSLGYDPVVDKQKALEFQTDFWFLTSQFLLSYFDLKSFARRCRSHFNDKQNVFEIPQELFVKFEQMAVEILNGNPGDFDRFLCENNHEKLKELLWIPFSLNQPIKIEANHLTDYVISIHSFLNFIVECGHRRENLSSSIDFINKTCAQSFTFWKQSSSVVQEKIIEDLNKYKNSELIIDGHLYDYPEFERDLISSSPLFKIKKEFVQMNIQWFLADINPNLQPLFSELISLVENQIGQSSYSEFLELILNEEFSPRHSGKINLIPSNNVGLCRELLLAVSDDNEGSVMSFSSIMDKVLLHLVKCDNTKTVVFICNKWDNSIFESFHPQLTAWAKFRGVKFLFLLISGSKDISPLKITF